MRPVESAGSSDASIRQVRALDSPKVPIKNRLNGQINVFNKKIEEITIPNGLHGLDAKTKVNER